MSSHSLDKHDYEESNEKFLYYLRQPRGDYITPFAAPRSAPADNPPPSPLERSYAARARVAPTAYDSDPRAPALASAIHVLSVDMGCVIEAASPLSLMPSTNNASFDLTRAVPSLTTLLSPPPPLSPIRLYTSAMSTCLTLTTTTPSNMKTRMRQCKPGLGRKSASSTSSFRPSAHPPPPARIPAPAPEIHLPHPPPPPPKNSTTQTTRTKTASPPSRSRRARSSTGLRSSASGKRGKGGGVRVRGGSRDAGGAARRPPLSPLPFPPLTADVMRSHWSVGMTNATTELQTPETPPLPTRFLHPDSLPLSALLCNSDTTYPYPPRPEARGGPSSPPSPTPSTPSPIPS
ncbi:hypothetical protein R3P38DRAFT_3173387 [Favolaschia claudopus]|uniref:Uncharacterized protein n=1 Tax=Favolaschia claudopus TaxID=2862362 RepID=A0AAW0DER6_9AGAR